MEQTKKHSVRWAMKTLLLSLFFIGCGLDPFIPNSGGVSENANGIYHFQDTTNPLHMKRVPVTVLKSDSIFMCTYGSNLFIVHGDKYEDLVNVYWSESVRDNEGLLYIKHSSLSKDGLTGGIEYYDARDMMKTWDVQFTQPQL